MSTKQLYTAQEQNEENDVKSCSLQTLYRSQSKILYPCFYLWNAKETTDYITLRQKY